MKNLLLLFLIISMISCQDREAGDSQQETIDSLQAEISSLKRANDTLSEHLNTKSFLTKDYPGYFDTIPEPEEFILNDLQENPGLIPESAVLGGTMRFTAVKFINGELLVAEFEDGHIMGKAVYTYHMDKNGKLTYSYVGNIKY